MNQNLDEFQWINNVSLKLLIHLPNIFLDPKVIEEGNVNKHYPPNSRRNPLVYPLIILGLTPFNTLYTSEAITQGLLLGLTEIHQYLSLLNHENVGHMEPQK